MSVRSILRLQMAWVLGALAVGAPMLIVAAYWTTLTEIDEVLDDSLMQTALLLADRDLAPSAAVVPMGDAADTESQLVALGTRPDGTRLFTSQPDLPLVLKPSPGASVQHALGRRWHVYTVVQSDRVIQVAQPDSVRRVSAAEAASQLLLPLAMVLTLLGALLVLALRRGLQPLRDVRLALTRRRAGALDPLAMDGVASELEPLVATLNELLQRLSTAFEAQRQFVADAAHELRSPVTAVQLQAQVLERSRDPVERAQAAAELAAGVERARRLIEQLLQLSRATADPAASLPSTNAEVRLGELVRTVVGRRSAEAERRGIDLGADERGAPTVQGDAVQLEVLLGNLVDNALRHCPAGSVVDVTAEFIGGAPVLRVVDDGPGIAAEERERVFDRFYRGTSRPALDTGSGLGLAIARAIAERHRARVTLHDGPGGRGLEARVTFPAAG